MRVFALFLYKLDDRSCEFISAFKRRAVCDIFFEDNLAGDAMFGEVLSSKFCVFHWHYDIILPVKNENWFRDLSDLS